MAAVVKETNTSLPVDSAQSHDVTSSGNKTDSGSHDPQPSGNDIYNTIPCNWWSLIRVQCHHQHQMMKLKMIKEKLNNLNIITCKVDCSPH